MPIRIEDANLHAAQYSPFVDTQVIRALGHVKDRHAGSASAAN